MKCLSLDVKQPPINQPLKLSFFHGVKRYFQYFQQYFSNSVAVLKHLISLIILTIIFPSSNFVLSFFFFSLNIWRYCKTLCFTRVSTHFSIHSDFRVIEHVQIVVVHDDRVVYYIISFDICNLFYCFMGGYPFCSDCTPSVLFCQIEFCSMYSGCVLLALFCGGYPFCSDCTLSVLFCGGYPFCSDCTLSVLFCQIEFCSMYPDCDLLALFHRTCILFFTFICFSLNRFGPFLCRSLELVLCFIWLWPFDTVSLELL